MLNLIHVRTFLTVTTTQGVRAAARQLELSPSTVADHLRQLEEHLAAPLFVRRLGGARLTDQGGRFLPLARALINTAGRVRNLVHLPGLRIAASNNVGTYLLQPYLADFQLKSGLQVEQWIGSNPEVIARLEQGEADLAAMEWWDARPGFIAQTWMRERLVVIVRPSHRWARLGVISVAELQTEPLLGGEAGTGTGYLLRQKLGPLADSLVILDGFGSTEAVKRAVRAGRGASIVMESSVADEVESGHLVALQIEGIDLAKEIKLIVPEALPASAPAMTLLAASASWAGISGASSFS
ncbi:MAG: Transcriptional [Beijerinckiaceae bacterium]|nr:MAG: Transcriptional [Beijerinckiaceae bacterium]